MVTVRVDNGIYKPGLLTEDPKTHQHDSDVTATEGFFADTIMCGLSVLESICSRFFIWRGKMKGWRSEDGPSVISEDAVLTCSFLGKQGNLLKQQGGLTVVFVN